MARTGGGDVRDRRRRDGLFPAGSPIRRAARAVNAIPLAGRMVLMELAHPAIAAAVNDHDWFRDDPIRRAEVTAKAIGQIIHGSADEASAVSRHLADVHARVRGTRYAASDPSLLLWVAATYFDSVFLAMDLWGRPLSPDEQEELFEQMTVVIELLGCPRERQPQSWPEFHRYVRSMLDTVEVSAVAVELARDIFWPSRKRRHDVPMAVYRLVSFGHLPPRLRSAFGYEWPRSRDRRHRLLLMAAPWFRPMAEATLHRLSDGQGRTMRVLMGVGGYGRAVDPNGISPP